MGAKGRLLRGGERASPLSCLTRRLCIYRQSVPVLPRRSRPHVVSVLAARLCHLPTRWWNVSDPWEMRRLQEVTQTVKSQLLWGEPQVRLGSSVSGLQVHGTHPPFFPSRECAWSKRQRVHAERFVVRSETRPFPRGQDPSGRETGRFGSASSRASGAAGGSGVRVGRCYSCSERRTATWSTGAASARAGRGRGRRHLSPRRVPFTP